MKFAHVLIALLALPLAACASKKDAEAAPASGQVAAPARGGNNPLERMFGANAEPNAGACPLLGVL